MKLKRPYQVIRFNNKKYTNTYGLLGCFNCDFEYDEINCHKINKTMLCGQKNFKREDIFEFVFKEINKQKEE